MKRLVMFLVVVMGFSVYGANIAFIDSQKVFSSHPEAKKASEALNKEVEQRQTELKVAEEEILAMREELEKSLSKEARKKKEVAIRVKVEALEMSRQSAISAIREKQIKLEEGINKKIYSLISALAKKKKIDLVLDKRSVIYGVPTLDITDEIIKKLSPGEGMKTIKKGGKK
ncbi:MAG: OmpH family outer membrane protein [Candidatus Desantisbacteria bacterium]